MTHHNVSKAQLLQICPKLLMHADSEILPQGQHPENGKSTRGF